MYRWWSTNRFSNCVHFQAYNQYNSFVHHLYWPVIRAFRNNLHIRLLYIHLYIININNFDHNHHYLMMHIPRWTIAHTHIFNQKTVKGKMPKLLVVTINCYLTVLTMNDWFALDWRMIRWWKRQRPWWCTEHQDQIGMWRCETSSLNRHEMEHIGMKLKVNSNHSRSALIGICRTLSPRKSRHRHKVRRCETIRQSSN